MIEHIIFLGLNLLFGFFIFFCGVVAEKNILKTKLRQSLKEVHGGGNGRRIISSLIDEI